MSAREWKPIGTYPMTGPVLHVEARGRDGTIYPDAHYACGDGDGLMPPFDGWFEPMSGGRGFSQIRKPVEWREREPRP